MSGLPAAIWIEVIGLSLLHFLWQGSLIAGLFWLVDRRLRASDPRLRYLVSLAFLGLFAICALGTATYLVASQGPGGAVEASGQQSSGMLLPGGGTPEGSHPSQPPGWLSAVVLLWFAGVVAYGSYLLLGLHRLGRIRQQAERAPEWLQLRMQGLLEGFGICRPVYLGISHRIQGPLTIGWLKPAILVPPAVIAGFPPHQLQMILAHELAHIRRHDYLVNLLQLCLETLLFYHPAVHWVSNRVRCLREECCDDLAVSALEDRYGYARTLAELETMRHPGGGLAVNMADGQMLSRIRRLIEPRRKQRGFAGITMILAGLLVTALAVLTHSFVGSNSEDENPPAAAQQAAELRASHEAVSVVLAGNRITRLASVNEPPRAEASGPDNPAEESSRTDAAEETSVDPDREPRTRDPDEEADPVEELRREANAAEVADQILRTLEAEEGWFHPEADLGDSLRRDRQERTESLDEDRDAQMEDRGRRNLERMRERAQEQRAGENDQATEQEDAGEEEGDEEENGEQEGQQDTIGDSQHEPDALGAPEDMEAGTDAKAIALSGDTAAEYPTEALAAGADGRVVLSLEVRGDGQVTGVEVVENDSPGYGFARAAKKAMEDMAFVPSLSNGEHVTVTRAVEFSAARADSHCPPRTGSRLNGC